jgi:hypothetical protein
LRSETEHVNPNLRLRTGFRDTLTAFFEKAELPPAIEGRVPIRVKCGPAGLKQIVQATGKVVEILVVAAGVEILELELTPNHARPLLLAVTFRFVRMARPTSLA